LIKIVDFPLVLFVVSLATLWLSARIGTAFALKLRPVKEDERDDLLLVINASLTLLALIIGFTFSMAVSRYDQRKNYEEQEANAIGTEYVRIDLLPEANASEVRHWLIQYLNQRLLFYTGRDPQQLEVVNNETEKLQAKMWSAVQGVARTQPPPTAVLTLSGMNDVLNSQGYTQAAWLNRIPVAAWSLMATLAICCCLLTGYRAHRKSFLLLAILPFLVSTAFFLIADSDSPRRGVIRVSPQNLIILSQSLHEH
jgi:hypothetical protein